MGSTTGAPAPISASGDNGPMPVGGSSAAPSAPMPTPMPASNPMPTLNPMTSGFTAARPVSSPGHFGGGIAGGLGPTPTLPAATSYLPDTSTRPPLQTPQAGLAPSLTRNAGVGPVRSGFTAPNPRNAGRNAKTKAVPPGSPSAGINRTSNEVAAIRAREAATAPVISGTRVSETPMRGRQPGRAKTAMGATPPPKAPKSERILNYTTTDEQFAELQRIANQITKITDYADFSDNVAEWVADKGEPAAAEMLYTADLADKELAETNPEQARAQRDAIESAIADIYPNAVLRLAREGEANTQGEPAAVAAPGTFSNATVPSSPFSTGNATYGPGEPISGGFDYKTEERVASWSSEEEGDPSVKPNDGWGPRVTLDPSNAKEGDLVLRLEPNGDGSDAHLPREGEQLNEWAARINKDFITTDPNSDEGLARRQDMRRAVRRVRAALPQDDLLMRDQSLHPGAHLAAELGPEDLSGLIQGGGDMPIGVDPLVFVGPDGEVYKRVHGGWEFDDHSPATGILNGRTWNDWSAWDATNFPDVYLEELAMSAPEVMASAMLNGRSRKLGATAGGSGIRPPGGVSAKDHAAERQRYEANGFQPQHADVLAHTQSTRGFLDAHEAKPGESGKNSGHTKRDHTEKDDDELKARMEQVEQEFNEGKRTSLPDAISSYPDQDTAERSIALIIQQRRSEIRRWMNDSNAPQTQEFDGVGDLGYVTGRGVKPGGGDAFDMTGARVVFRKRKNGTVFILTSYPIE